LRLFPILLEHLRKFSFMVKNILNLPLLLIGCFLISFSGLHAQSQIIPHTASTDIFKTDYLLKQSYDYNPKFIRTHDVKSIRLYSEITPDEATQDRFFTQYNFDEWGLVSEKIYFQETDVQDIALTMHKFFYNDEDKIERIEEYYEDKFAVATWFVYNNDGQLESVFEEDTNGRTGNRSEYLVSNQQVNQKTTYSNNKIRQLEYHLPVAVLLENPDTLRRIQPKDLSLKRTYFYLYEGNQIVKEFWYTPIAEYNISREYDSNKQLVNIKKIGEKTTTATYKYSDAGNIKRIKINRAKRPTKQRRFFYDDEDIFVIKSEVKRDGEVLESLIYEYQFW